MAAEKSREKHPGIQIVGAYSPPFKPLLEMDHEAILDRLRSARPDLLLIDFGCPKQEKWINMHYARAGVPVCIGVGATIDFLAGAFKRAPVWMQRSGLEWIFRMLQEPKRLAGRYGKGLWVFGCAALRQWWQLRRRRHPKMPIPTADLHRAATCNRLVMPVHLDAESVREQETLWQQIMAQPAHLLVDLASVEFIDSTGLGLLVRLQKHLRAAERQMLLVAATDPVQRALKLMRFSELMTLVPSLESAHVFLADRLQEQNVVVTLNLPGEEGPLAWQGEIVAGTAEEVWNVTRSHLESSTVGESGFTINLAEVRFIDSTGVGVMIRVKKYGHRRGLLVRFSEPPPSVCKVLDLMKMKEYLLETRS
jgi:N-acetylglucosaminyldiphosphoundecaprenol N-acetyl-beta-D-mannosaminyltransferase